MLKKISLLLIAVFLCMSVMSCSKEQGKTEETGETGETTATTITTMEETSMEDALGFTPSDNGKRTFTILACDASSYEFYSEDISGDLVNDAVHNRNINCEDLFNINIEIILKAGGWAERAEFNNYITNDVLSDSGEYDLVSGISVVVAQSLNTDTYYNVADIDSIDLSHTWWINNQFDELSINGNLFCLLGDSNLTIYKNLNVYLYNLKVVENFKLDNPLDMVKDGSWTLDNMLSLARDTRSDLNGDGTISINDDVLGFASNYVLDRSHLTSFDLDIIYKNDSGIPSLVSTLSEKFIDAYSKMYYAWLITDDNIVSADYGNYISALAEDRLLFATAYLNVIEKEELRNMSSDYGVLPYPKYDENQKSYYTQLGTSTTAIYFPQSISDIELSGQVCEYMAYYGQSKIVGAYYETMLKDRLARDVNMSEMLDLVRDSATFSFTMMYNTNFSPIISQLFQFRNTTDNGENIASKYVSYYEVYDKSLDTLIESFTD